jgi:N-glycosylase/DNA lyase
MNIIPLKNYNLEDTLIGGQSFTWRKDGDTYIGFTSRKVIVLKENNGSLEWQTFPENNDKDFIINYLRLNEPYEEILKEIQKDEYVEAAIKEFPNLRILKQDFELTLLTFLISANNSIKSIRRSVNLMAEKFGEKVQTPFGEVSLFPSTETIANLTIEELRSCSLGFRAKYLKASAQHLIDTKLLDRIHQMPEEEVRKELMAMQGVGPKIADCIMVFALGYESITPMDVWGKRILTEFYGQPENMKYDDMRNWIKDYFEGKGAWAGQFLFEYIRTRPQKKLAK